MAWGVPNIFGKPKPKAGAGKNLGTGAAAKAVASMYQQPSMQSYEKDTPLNAAAIRYNQENPGLHKTGVTEIREGMRALAGYQPPSTGSGPLNLGGPGSGGSGGGGGGRRRGGGGGGGAGNAAALAQSQLDYMMQLLGSKSYTAAPETALRDAINQRQQGITAATQGDLATANTAWSNLDTWLSQNQTNPYANVQLQRAPTSPDYNPYLESQGVQPLAQVNQNPQDPYGGFQNVLALLGANFNQQAQSQQAGSQMGRASSVTGINAMDNAYQDAIRQQLAQVADKEYQNQQALDAEKRQAAISIAPLLGQGAKAPADLLALLGMQQ
jgi:hypothetical protein